jgi:hypothetical protein
VREETKPCAAILRYCCFEECKRLDYQDENSTWKKNKEQIQRTKLVFSPKLVLTPNQHFFSLSNFSQKEKRKTQKFKK